jgi:hypothetical protein
MHELTPAQLRQVLDASGYLERAGRDILVTVAERHPAAPEFHQPPGTMSETLWYSESRVGKLVRVAVLHQFVLPDGRVNNRAGLPDPKYIRIGDDQYKLARRPQKPPRGPPKKGKTST